MKILTPEILLSRVKHRKVGLQKQVLDHSLSSTWMSNAKFLTVKSASPF